MKQRLAEMSRKTTVLRVNEEKLTRRFTSMQEVEMSLRKVRLRTRTSVLPEIVEIMCFFLLFRRTRS